MSSEGDGKSRPALPDSFAATLVGLIEKSGANPEESKPDVTAAAAYLAPYLEQLAALEENLPPFPASGHAGPWAEVEAEAINPLSRLSLMEIGRKHGVRKNYLYEWAKRRRWKERRQVALEIRARMTVSATMIAVGSHVSPARREVAEQDEDRRTMGLIDRTLAVYEAQLESGQVQIKPRDVDTLIRLGKFLRGKAESIKENRNTVTVDAVNAAAKKAAKSISAMDMELAGIVTDAEFEVQDGGGDGSSEEGPLTPADIVDQLNDALDSHEDSTSKDESPAPDETDRRSLAEKLATPQPGSPAAKAAMADGGQNGITSSSESDNDSTASP